MNRKATLSRKTKESDITVSLDLDGTGKHQISTGIGFFDHMLTAFAVHGGFDLEVSAIGDLEIDTHHTVEDTAIVLGQVFAKALGNKEGIERFGSAFVPMDETLAHTSVDLSGRAYFVITGEPEDFHLAKIYGNVIYATVINKHFFETFANNAAINLHIRVLYGSDPHHISEAEFKSLARSLRQAVKITGSDIPSTKGSL